MNTPIVTLAHAAPSERLLAIENEMERVAGMLVRETLSELHGADAITDEMRALAYSVRRLRTFLTKQTLRVQVMEQAQRLPSRRERAVRVGFST